MSRDLFTGRFLQDQVNSHHVMRGFIPPVEGPGTINDVHQEAARQ